MQKIQKALESQRQQADIINLGKKVSEDVNALSSLASSALEVSSALQFSGGANPVKAVMSAVSETEIAVLGAAKVQEASAFANVPVPEAVVDFSLDANHILVLNVLALVVWKFLRHVQLECLIQILRFKPMVPG